MEITRPRTYNELLYKYIAYFCLCVYVDFTGNENVSGFELIRELMRELTRELLIDMFSI